MDIPQRFVLLEDGDVDGTDFLTWRRAFGSNDPAADANKNGIVDAADYTIRRDNIEGRWLVSVYSSQRAGPASWLLGIARVGIAWALVRFRR